MSAPHMKQTVKKKLLRFLSLSLFLSFALPFSVVSLAFSFFPKPIAFVPRRLTLPLPFFLSTRGEGKGRFCYVLFVSQRFSRILSTRLGFGRRLEAGKPFSRKSFLLRTELNADMYCALISTGFSTLGFSPFLSPVPRAAGRRIQIFLFDFFFFH